MMRRRFGWMSSQSGGDVRIEGMTYTPMVVRVGAWGILEIRLVVDLRKRPVSQFTKELEPRR